MVTITKLFDCLLHAKSYVLNILNDFISLTLGNIAPLNPPNNLIYYYNNMLWVRKRIQAW